ncbi:uncharacterized oxidoreductase SSP0419-like [Oppia nitens]|uniref:uncharacterized oxidoreductase SSP0419-like n=1 Tax=Oppia nitens TaxID=1686743 RepID=UPI0023DC34E5|nr:uncharacterized oxidoreductase SSP0419-like [Oppia nitens]
MSNCRDFNQKVALITGSSSGIGEEIALYLSSLGAQVVITGRDEDKVRSVAERCRELSLQKVLEVMADLSKYEDIERLIYETIDEFGKLDILVNCAGVSQITPITSPDLMIFYDEIMSVNVKSILYLSSLSVPYLEKTKGNIVNVSSVCGIRPLGPLMVFCMSKSALDMLTQCLAQELGPKGIRVNSINPASIQTPMYDKFGIESFSLDTIIEMSAKNYPLARIGQPIDCAKAVAYLASDDASFISGVLMPVDGASIYANMTAPLSDHNHDNQSNTDCYTH